jgi:hypothetical protein
VFGGPRCFIAHIPHPIFWASKSFLMSTFTRN